VALFDSTTIQNTVSQNSIFANGARGITLYGNANNQQSFPVLNSAVLGSNSNSGGTDVSGTLNSAASTAYRIEFFANTVGDPSGFGEGQFFIGSINVFTSKSGNASFTASLQAAVPVGYIITAKAIDPLGNTSEHSAGTSVTTSDSDQDGMPNDYEIDQGFNRRSFSDGGLDSDGDGMTNLQEFKAGTDPRSAASVMRISSVSRANGVASFTFQTVAGKTYRIEYKDDLTQAGWSSLVDNVFTTLPTLLQISDPGAAGATRRFYRVTVVF
jgi:hypothetical protein